MRACDFVLPSCLPADTLLGTLTVEEMLMYTAELKRPTSHSHAQKKKAVEELVELLALEGCRNVLIGRCWRYACCHLLLAPELSCMHASDRLRTSVNINRLRVLGCASSTFPPPRPPTPPMQRHEQGHQRRAGQARQHWHCPGHQPPRALPG